MSRAAHAPSALAAFQNGEERLIYARYRAAPHEPAYYLVDGTARSERDWVKEHVECFMPECDSRTLTTVARSSGRDGFKHMRGAGGHSREGMFHQQGKALIARWVGERYPEVAAVIEQATSSRDRRADVMLTWVTGEQVAIEVQYAPLTVHDWLLRHEAYSSQGIPCIWLLGHTGAHLRVSTRGQDQDWDVVRLSLLHRAMAKQKVPLLWLNPIDETIGTVNATRLVDQCTVDMCGYVHDCREFLVAPHEVGDAEPYLEFSIDQLTECELSPSGLRTPTLHDLARNRLELLAAQAADSAKEREYMDQQRRKRLDAKRVHLEDQQRRQRELGEYNARYPQAGNPRQVPSGMLVCSVCRRSLDPTLARSGKHVLC